jgi:aminocarboxymuconate-semialdehyde decarboxylase
VLRGLVDFVGADHILLGSDYPFDMGNENPADLVRAANLGIDSEKKILGDNASQLLNWEV